MPVTLTPASLNTIRELEEIRRSKVLVIAASHLDMEILPALYEQLLAMGKSERLDVVLQCRGGVVNAARRIALLLRQFCRHLSFIVPYYCESSATILALAGDEIVAGEMAMFSPIDPHMNGGVAGDEEACAALSCMDLKLFPDMTKDWFGIISEEAQLQAFSQLCGSMFPPTLTAFYRTTKEVEQVAMELLAFHLPQKSEEFHKKIIHQLMYGYYSHNYAITAGEMKKLGLNIERNAKVEQLAWDISRMLQGMVGGALRQSREQAWIDVAILSANTAKTRLTSEDGMMPSWAELCYP